MENIENMTIIKEHIDRLSSEMAGAEQKMTFLEQSIEKQRKELENLKAERDATAKEMEELKEMAAHPKKKKK